MWLKRVLGGQREVFLGRETILGEPFEVADADVPPGLLDPPKGATAKDRAAWQPDARFKKPSAAEVSKARKAADQAPDTQPPTLSGGVPAGPDAQPLEEDE